MRWIPITIDDLKTAGHGFIVDRATTTATGSVDPASEEIANAVARVRRAVAAANTLDVNPTKVPKSLKGVTVRLALYALMERIRMPLSDDQRETRKADYSDLLRIADRKVRLEEPDDPDTEATPPNRGTWNSENKILPRAHPIPRPGRQNAVPGRYANPDGPEDTV